MVEKPKTSTIDTLTDNDRVLVDRLLVAIRDMYNRIHRPLDYGPHTNFQMSEDAKSKVLLLSLKVGERLWHPRGKLTGHLYQPRLKSLRTKKK